MSDFEIIVAIYAICAALTLFLYHNAPYGWEDEDGFHEGKQEDI